MTRIYEPDSLGLAWTDGADRPLAGRRVLVVEDEALIAMEIQAVLESAGAAVLGPATTISRAKELAGLDRISAAVLDLRLGKVSVEPVARLLEARAIPFFFYSGQALDDPLTKVWPNIVFITKPAHHSRIVEELVRLTEGSTDFGDDLPGPIPQST